MYAFAFILNNLLFKLYTEPELWDIIKIVIPKVQAKWKHLSYSMQYSIVDVEGIEKDFSNVGERCEKLFSDWLTTAKGAMPKSWLTLLNCIRDVEGLHAIAEDINKELKSKFCKP